VIASIRTSDPAGLESDLMLHLLRLKRQRRLSSRRETFLWIALRNKAKNWVRDQQHREHDLVSISMTVDPAGTDADRATFEDRLTIHESDQADRVAFDRLLDELTPELRQVWRALKRADGNQIQAARALKIHRNTLRMKLRLIQRLAARHGFRGRR
jgi:DNA-directed RNA polymerase specialized sigma24 family protein